MKLTKMSFFALLAAMMFFASTASAAIVIGGSDGWSFSTDGMVNLFAVYQNSESLPDDVNPLYATPEDGFRLKNGFLPNILAFNIKAPTMKGLDMAARIGFYPSATHGNTKNSFDSQIDLREVFFTVDGNFGQFMIGKGLSLFLGQNLLTEQALMGAGQLGSALGLSGAGVTIGRIGYGYIYPQFNSQVRYTTPDLNGFKIALGLYDPSQIVGGFNNADFVIAQAATRTKLPRVEAEVSYAGTYGMNNNPIKLYTNALWQEADFVGGGDVTAWGVSVGGVMGMGGFELVGSAFTGKALGTSLMLDVDSIDWTGRERRTWGYIGQLTYTMDNEGKTKFGVSYGSNHMAETAGDRFARANIANGAHIKRQSMLTFMATQDITSNLKLVGEVNFVEHAWHNGRDWNAQQFNVGTFFLW